MIFFLALLLDPCFDFLLAVQTDKFFDDTFSDFSEGEAHGIAITTDGFLKIGPSITKWASLPTSIIWAAIRNSNDTLFVAAGNEGQVFKVNHDGKVTEFFKAKELQVQALAFDPSDNLFAASTPNGKIYRIDTDGKASVFFDPKEKYIWALQFDEKGNLFVATGEKGKLYKVSPSGKGTIFYDSNETHLRTLLMDNQKHLWAGSEGNGLVYRFDHTEGSSSTPFVAYDSSFREIKAMLASPNGSLFVAAMGDRKFPPERFTSVSQLKLQSVKTLVTSPTTIEPGEEIPQMPFIEDEEDGSEMEGIPSFLKPTGKSDAAEIINILPNGSTEKWWSGKEDIYCLAMPEPGRILAGTSKKGKLIEITGPKQFSILNQLEAETITSLIRWDEKDWLAATSNPGALWTLTMTPNHNGFFESKIFDTRASSRWGVVDIQKISGAGLLHIETRSGNTSKPDKVWSAWTPVDQQNRIQSPLARFIQYKIIIETTEKTIAGVPAIDSVTLYYQASNQPPQISRITLYQPNMMLIKTPRIEFPQFPLLPSIPSLGKNVPARTSKPGSAENRENPLASQIQPPTFQQTKKLGWRSIFWQASDPNNDELRYDVFYRAAGSNQWKLLKENLNDPFLSWDAATWPDGEYYIKIIATDRLSNPVGEALTDEMISDVFTVDNTAPTINVNVSQKTIKKGFIAITIYDTTSIVDKAEFSIDGEEWRPLLPLNKLYDSKSNNFLIPIEKLSSEYHYVVIRASDSANNIATQTTRFQK